MAIVNRRRYKRLHAALRRAAAKEKPALSEQNTTVAAPGLAETLWKGAKLTCPRCGEGKLFSSYLKRKDACDACGESFLGLDADDGPAWLTIGIVAHIVIPLLWLLERDGSLSYGTEFAILAAVTIGATLLTLPFAKGLFIAALWRIRRDGR
ncbi:DUF983 domain-containing protein [Methylocystis heyeri]|uniref:DUF983 domain-containing protein n=1 Tax=Methylocystis heyeri TaxID=391905 RepID=A0A6B8KCU3_9HYPH|nr:DUF983 domain-containing protein [Methylocystis heyeri]